MDHSITLHYIRGDNLCRNETDQTKESDSIQTKKKYETGNLKGIRR